MFDISVPPRQGVRNKKARSVAGVWLRAIVIAPYSKTMDGTMASFIVTFKFKSDDTRGERYDSFVKKINELTSYRHWDETTSFYCFELDTTAETLCTDLYIGSDFNSTKDIMVVIDITNKQKATKGALAWPSVLDSYLGF